MVHCAYVRYVFAGMQEKAFCGWRCKSAVRLPEEAAGKDEMPQRGIQQ